MSFATHTHTNSGQLIKESSDGSISLVSSSEGLLICHPVEKSKEKKIIRLNDVYACFRNTAELTLESCPRGHIRKWGCFKMCRDTSIPNPYERQCRTDIVKFCSEAEAEDWRVYIKKSVVPAYTKAVFEGGPARKLLVIVNPIGGKGKGEEIFHELLKPMLEGGGTNHEMIVTTGPMHAEKIAETLDLSSVGAICVVGGDGLFGEVLNGLNRRPIDRMEALSIPIGIVPAGSSNCLACSVGLRQPLAAAFSIARGITKPLDTLKVTLDNNKVILSVCGVSYGFISEVNTHAGKWRWLFGPARYSVCGLRTVLGSPLQYHVDCRFQPPSKEDSDEAESTECGPDCLVCAKNQRRPSDDPSQPKSPDRSYVGSFVLGGSSQSSVRSTGETAEAWVESSAVMGPRRRSLTNGKRKETEDASTLLLFSITNLSIRQSQNKTVWNPYCHMASGHMDLVLMPVISRLQLLKFFAKFAKTKHIDKKNDAVFSVIKAKSVEMKLTKENFEQLPQWERAIQIAIDGEIYPLQPLRVDTLHGLLNLMLS